MTFGSTKLAARLAAIIRTIPIVHRSNESSDLRLSLHSTIMSRLYGILIVLVLTSSVKTELVRTRPYAFDAKAYESNTEESNAEAYDAKAYESRKSELMFVSVVFRHGDRAPDDNGKELYPNDPYLKYSFFPMGLGGLTNNGKMREYSLGEELRERYSNFLGTTYLPTDIVARSTDYSRTKMSLTLVLASLYPPDRLQRWNSKLRWQPIPSTYVPNSLDVLLIPEECPQYLEELERVKSLPEVKKQVDKFRPLMEKLTKLTGKPIKDTNDMYYLYHDLMAESSMGLKLPRWTKPLFPYGPLWNGTILEYDIVSYNEMLKRLNGGTLLRRITDDMVAAIKNGTRNARKMNIFSGHETNIAALLQTLGVYKPHVPEYSSATFVELIRQNDVYYVQVLYYLGIPPDVVALTIPDCEQLCPLDAFLQLLENVIPTDGDLVCPNSTQPPTGF